MTDPLRPREEAAVRGYRESGADEHLDVLRQDGLLRLMHNLTMERYSADPSEYTARVDAWLAGGTGGSL